MPLARPSSSSSLRLQRVPRRCAALPAPARELSQPWRSRAGEIPGLTPELEREFRFGQRAVAIEGRVRLGGAIKGGSSAMWVPAPADLLRVYRAWADVDGLPNAWRPVAWWRLRRLCRAHGIELRSGAPGARHSWSRRLGAVYVLARAVLAALPSAHLDSPHFRVLQIGGWGPDAAKASAYEDGTVMCYDFAVKGARRTFVGLLLHELGHAREAAASDRERAEWQEWHATIAAADAFVGTEFLASAASRRQYQAHAWTEFAAETYMVYCAQGERLRAHVAGTQGPVRDAWDAVYARCMAWFGSIEYK